MEQLALERIVLMGFYQERLIVAIDKSKITELVITDTIPKTHNSSKVREISVAPFLANTIKAVVANESISSTWRSNNK